MSNKRNPIVETYSELADKYDYEGNFDSCWGRVTKTAASSIRLKEDYRSVVDVGCGTGWALVDLAKASSPDVQFIGIDPAENMCKRARKLADGLPNVRILQGSFENLPLDTNSADYLYSTLAFHWCTDLDRAVSQLARVLKPSADMDLIFVGRDNGKEFIRKTSPIFLKYMGPALLLESARLRKQLPRKDAEELFCKAFPERSLTVDESHKTYYDTLEGHWSWWVRIEGHFVKIPPERKEDCDAAVKAAIASLGSDDRIPYTVHLLHVKLRRR